MSEHTYSEDEVLRIARQAVRETMSHSMSLPRDEAAEIAKVAALTAVQETTTRLFSQLGVNIADMDDVNRLRDNLTFMEKLRVGSSNLAGAIIKAVAVAIVLIILAWMAVGAKDALQSHAVTPTDR